MKTKAAVVNENIQWSFPILTKVLKEVGLPIDTFNTAITAADKVREAQKELDRTIESIFEDLGSKGLTVANEQKLEKALKQERIIREYI